MSYNKPNDPSAGVNPAATATQAILDSLDLSILAAGHAKTGVLSGCAVTQAGTPNMTVLVAAGVVSVNGTYVTVAAATKTISANASGNHRLDLICVSAAGAVTTVNGAAAAAPDYPAVAQDADGKLLRAVIGVVYVANGATAISTANITDTRVFLTATGNIIDTSTVGTDVSHFSSELTDLAAYTHGQTQSFDDYAAMVIHGTPAVSASKTLPFYSGLLLEGGPTVGAGGQISQHMGLAMHWDAPVGVTTPLTVGVFAHVGVVGGTVTKMRGIHVELQQFAAEITQGTGFYFMASMAIKSWGAKIGGTVGSYVDYWPTYHMGPIAMGGTPATTTDGGIFNPAAMLDVREVRQLVYTVSITTTNASTAITTVAPGLFDWLFDNGAAISGTNIPGGATISNPTPNSATLSAAATGTGTVTATITKVLTDAGASSLRLTPAYDGSATVARHHYMRINRPTLTNGAAVTDASVFYFPNATGVHEALSNGATKTTPGGVDGFMKINVAGTLYFVPMYLSKTA